MRIRALSRLGLVLLVAAGLLGADCPHCDFSHDAIDSGPHAAASCHEAPASPDPVHTETEPTLDCGCPGCGDAAAIASMVPGPEPGRSACSPASRLDSTVPAVRPCSPDWHPPPYPGFVENTVVLLI